MDEVGFAPTNSTDTRNSSFGLTNGCINRETIRFHGARLAVAFARGIERGDRGETMRRVYTDARRHWFFVRLARRLLAPARVGAGFLVGIFRTLSMSAVAVIVLSIGQHLTRQPSNGGFTSTLARLQSHFDNVRDHLFGQRGQNRCVVDFLRRPTGVPQYLFNVHLLAEPTLDILAALDALDPILGSRDIGGGIRCGGFIGGNGLIDPHLEHL